MPGPVAALLALLAPARCVSCGSWAGHPWCPACEAAAGRLRPADACPRCGGDRGGVPRGGGHGCWAGAPPVARLDAVYAYRGVVAETVVSAKVRGAWRCLEPLGRHIAAVTPSDPAVDAVCWVPAEPGRRRRRGRDHAQLLARGVASGLGLPVVPALRCRPGSPDQGRRRLTERIGLPPGTFRASRRLDGARLLLVDDVVTTGATCACAARALTAAGAGLVRAAVLARAGRHRLGARVDRCGSRDDQGSHMQITVKGTNLDLNERIKTQAVDKLSKVTQLFDRFIDMEIVFSEESNPRIPDKIHCEVVLHAKGNYLRAEAQAPDPLTAIDAAQKKLVRQVRKMKTKLVDNSRQPPPEPTHAGLVDTDVIDTSGHPPSGSQD